MKTFTWVLASLVIATALAGCTQQPSPPHGGTATAVRVVEGFEEESRGNEQVLVCWHVDGTGNVPHTAIHYDTTPHPGSGVKFGDYRNAAYPNNQTAQASAGYNLPGDFCTNLPVATQDVYFRAHVIDSRGGDGILTDEREIEVGGGAPTTTLAVRFVGSFNSTAMPGSNVTVCWNVTGTGRIPHTAIHTDNTSHPAATSFSDYKGTAYYPNNRTSQDPAGYALPSQFCTGVTAPMNGTIWLRAHAMNSPPGVLSVAEQTLTAGNGTGNATSPGVAGIPTFVGVVNTTAPAGSNVTVCWQATGVGNVPHTALHYGPVSQATNVTATFQSYPNAAYPGNTTSQAAAGYALPGPWCSNVMMPTSGTVYVRAHVIDSTGAPGKLGFEEKAIVVA
jgi:hypothetical protein